MASASYLQPSFLGGEISLFAQGDYERQDYRNCMSWCFNGLPLESKVWVRRPGTTHADFTRGGNPGRVIKYDFKAIQPYMMEFTDGHLRFFVGPNHVTTNDSVGVSSVSTANPAVVNTAAAVTWATGDQAFFTGLGNTSPLLQGRVFILTKVDTTHFSIADAITGAAIDGSTLAWATTAGATLNRNLDLATPYVSGSWATLRSVQTETVSFLLQGSYAPQALTVSVAQTPSAFAQLALNPAVFNDGPYLDPFTNGVQATPSAMSGIINLTLAFPAYVSTQAYALGAFVTSSSVNYVSLVDQNVGNTPVSSPSQWAAAAAGQAINNGLGFLGGDIGRLVRLFSEPALWAVGTAYTTGNVVAYNPSGLPGQTTYWTALTSTTGNQPGLDLVHWTLTPQGGAIWSWGKITALLTMISGALAGAVKIGNMTGNGGLAAAFDGNIAQSSGACADAGTGTVGTYNLSVDAYVGQNYSGASAQKVSSVQIYPSTDRGYFYYYQYDTGGRQWNGSLNNLTFNLRAKASSPASPSDGTLLGTSGNITSAPSGPVTILSSDASTAWNYVWIEIVAAGNANPFGGQFLGASLDVYVSEVQFFNPPGTGISNGITIEVLGPPLLYTTPVRTWRLGVYSNTTGWPTCGCYQDGRLWLSGAIPNRADSCYANGVVQGTVNFAPTDQYGVVTAAHAISAIATAKDSNPIFSMEPDDQGIICFTQNREWLISAPTPGPISPVNIQFKPKTAIGSANVPPIRTDHTVLFVQRWARKIMEFFADVFSGRFTAPNLSEAALHIPVGVQELAYVSGINPTVWGRNQGGSLFSITYQRNTLSTAQPPTFAAWARHALGGPRTVVSLASGPNVDGSLDSLTLVTLDSATGLYHVEVMNDVALEGQTLAQATYVDDDISPSSIVSTSTASSGAPYGGLTLNGLWHLNGKTVTAWLGGLDCGDYTVSSGSIFVPYGDGVSAGTGAGFFTAAFAATLVPGSSAMSVGFTYTSQGQIVRPNAPAESGARNGPAFGKKRRTHQYACQFEGTGYDGGLGGSVSFGCGGPPVAASYTADLPDFTTVTFFPANFRSDNLVAYTVQQQFTGTYWDQLSNDYSYDSMLCWQVTRPYICNIVAIGGFIETQDK